MSGLKEWQQYLRIPLGEIKKGTNNFGNCIGSGGYGRVYEGELIIQGKHMKVAVKRLSWSSKSGQGLTQFLTEIDLLQGLEHPNIISLIGFCDEDNEKIIIYELAERRSFDRYVRRSNATYTLTSLEKLKICADAARGLAHLHRGVGKHRSIIHRDIKSANILIDNNCVAKISDFGLGLACLGRDEVISEVCGTPLYCEPEYRSRHIVTKQSDIYSFGIVLFEVLCGRLCYYKEAANGFEFSGKKAIEYYEDGKLDKIVDPRLMKEMSSESINKFAAIAYGCMQTHRGHRSPMDQVTKELENLYKIQMQHEVDKNDDADKPL